MLEAARNEFFERYALFLMALRTGVRRGELVALQSGDIQFGADDGEVGRFIEAKRNYLYGRLTSPKSYKSWKIDMSRGLRRTLLELRDAKLLDAFAIG